MNAPDKKNPAGGRGLVEADTNGIQPKVSPIAAALQLRLSALALALVTVSSDMPWLQAMVQVVANGEALTDEERKRLDAFALRLFDAAEVLNGPL